MEGKLVNAIDVVVEYNDKVMGCLESAKFTVKQALDKSTCTASAGWDEFSAGTKGWSGSLNSAYREFTAAELADNVAMEDVFDALDNGATVKLSFGKKGAGKTRFEGYAFIESFDYDHPTEGTVKWSANFTGTGKIARVKSV